MTDNGLRWIDCRQTPKILAMLLVLGSSCLSPLNGYSASMPPAFRFTIKHFSIEGHSPLTLSFIEDYFKPLQDRSYTLKELQDVSKAFELKIRELGYPFYRVVVPPQTLSTGEVKLQIISFALGEIEVTDNHYFSKENIIRSLPVLKKDNSPNTQELSEALKIANRHPSKQVQVVFKPGKEPDKLDAKVAVADQRPYQATLTANNYGTSSSGDYRLTGALQYSNLWGLDHVVNGSYSTSPDHANAVQQYGVSYSLPLYRFKGWLSAYYANSSVNIGSVSGGLGAISITGSGELYGIHYQQFLPKWGSYEHSLDLGIDNRYFMNDLRTFQTTNSSNVRSVPFSIMYKGELPWQSTRSSYYIQWLGNTDFGGHNNQRVYEKAVGRPGIKQNWDLIRYGSTFSFTLKDWLAQTSFSGQHSNNPLIAGEQLGIGGSFDVRGYDQRETSADDGQIVKVELTTPAWSMLSFADGQKANLFAFYDYGHGLLRSTLPGQIKDWNLSGTGIGARFQWYDYFQGNIAFANALDSVETAGGSTKAGNNRIHANIVFKY